MRKDTLGILEYKTLEILQQADRPLTVDEIWERCERLPGSDRNSFVNAAWRMSAYKPWVGVRRVGRGAYEWVDPTKAPTVEQMTIIPTVAPGEIYETTGESLYGMPCMRDVDGVNGQVLVHEKTLRELMQARALLDELAEKWQRVA